ncbi:MAG: hypothetical protein GKS06_00735 [Acidobacteria bacterium]|nr:hypothetical protein [Acidobacteriota bacterium]
MPLRLVRAPDARSLWETCADRFLDAVGDNPGPDGFAAHLWVAQESQADLLYERAQLRDLPGWLAPPVTTMRHLAPRFDVGGKRLGLLTRRRMISRIARAVAGEVGMRDPSRGDGVVRGHMLDALFGELLPEGVPPDRLATALDSLSRIDQFARRRNQWIVRTYAAYLAELERTGRVDARQAGARVTATIVEGGLQPALGGADTLLIYGLYQTRSRWGLLQALAEQSAVDVSVFALSRRADDPGSTEWDELVESGWAVEDIAGKTDNEPVVALQPAPDTARETEWIARQVKRLLVEEDVEPHRVAVVARSGREDTGRVHRALADAGIQATTIIRARLTEIAAIKAMLTLFRGASAGWTYRSLRPVLDNQLFDIDIDLRVIDFIAHTRRVSGLEHWEAEIERLIERLNDRYEDSGAPRDRAVRGSGLFADSVGRDLERFRALRPTLEAFAADRTESDWISFTLELLRDQHPAAFYLRRRLCDPVGSETDARRWDTVRLDQRGVRQTEGLLREWLDLDHPREELDVGTWRTLLHRMLEANELSITTPLHKGVQVLEAHDAAVLPFEHVFVVHANDGVFPRRGLAGGVLSNEERSRLRERGIPLSSRDLELRRERALWFAATSTGAVTITYRTADPAGTPLLPSLLVPAHDVGDELPRTRTRYSITDHDFTPVTPAEADQFAAVTLNEALRADEAGARAPISPGTPALIPHAILGAVAESHRDTGASPLVPGSPAERPNPWNGWLRDARVLDNIGKRFGADYRWSASSLETYSKLPFQFLLSKVLGYEEAKEADEEVTPQIFGWMAHDLLEKFYAQVKDDLPAMFTDRAELAFERASEEVLAAAQEDDRWLGAAVFWEQQWTRIRGQVRSYLEWELVHLADKGERPALVEFAFGFGDERILINGKDAAGLAAELRLCGRVDRVDHGPKGDQVLDYKSGGYPGATSYQDGSALQAPLYMQVLENTGRTMSRGYYRSLKPSAKRTQYGGNIDRHKPIYDEVLRYALSIPGRVRGGLFEPVAGVRSKGWAPWYPARDIARSRAQLGEGNRFIDFVAVAPAAAPVSAPAPAAEPTPAVAPSASNSQEAQQRSLFDEDHTEDGDV